MNAIKIDQLRKLQQRTLRREKRLKLPRYRGKRNRFETKSQRRSA